jgi:hypothetical protein
MFKGPNRKPDREKPQRRARIAKDLPPRKNPDPGFSYSRKRDMHKHAKPDRELAYLTESQPWQRIIVPASRMIDKLRRGKRGPASSISTEQWIKFDLARVLLRCRSIDDTLTLLTAQRTVHQALREALDWVEPHWQGMPDGVPHRAAIYRAREGYFTDQVLWQLYRELYLALTHQLLQYPHVAEDAKLLFLDTVRKGTHFTAAHYHKDTKRLLNADHITAPGAGYVARTSGLNRSGDGFKAPFITTRGGLALHFSALPNNTPEPSAGQNAIAGLQRDFGHRLQATGRIIVADGAFSSPLFRRDIRSHGIVEVIHPVSHSHDARERAEKETARRLPIHGSNHWQANGHRELVCKCGHGRTENQRDYNTDGSVTVRIIGRCPNCPTLTITSGLWRTTPAGLVRITPYDRAQPNFLDEVDLLFGNPYTYNSETAADWGKQRFSQNEGFFGTLATRFGMFDRPGYYRETIDYELDLYAAVCLLHASALAYHQANTPTGA